ncbi:helix-turn-helix domain-containing protein [Rhizobium grahamii]|nr:helix-turn-helix domain-containing protein [Rhizobium grahamii]
MNLGGCNRKLLAVRLADFADDEGRGIYPGVKRLAAETELSERTIQRILADFVQDGILVVVKEASGRPGQATRYDFDLAALFGYTPKETGDMVSPVEQAGRVTNEQETGDTDDRDGCHGVTRTVIEPPLEPSSEREGARAGSEESDTALVEDRRKVEKEFKLWYRNWPTSLSDSEPAARRAWDALTVDERAVCLQRTPAFINAVKAIKGKFTFSSVYLSSRAWEKLDDPKSDVALPSVHNPFSRAWMAGLLAELMKAPNQNMPVPTAFQNQQLKAGGEAAEAVRRDRLRKYGWPRVNTMFSQAYDRKGVTVRPDLAALSEVFQRVDANTLERWKCAFESRGWPWLPNTGHEWFFFPAGEPEEALSDFSNAITRERGDDDGV